MDQIPITRELALLLMAFAFGATAWFFFVQSPVLLKKMGRERFVPIQMMLTVVLFRTLSVLTALLFVTSLFIDPFGSTIQRGALLALLACLINKFIVLPRALKAGGRTRAEVKGRDKEASTVGFAAEGVGSGTALLHRLVVLFVLIMVAGLLSTGWSLL